MSRDHLLLIGGDDPDLDLAVWQADIASADRVGGGVEPYAQPAQPVADLRTDGGAFSPTPAVNTTPSSPPNALTKAPASVEIR